MVRKLAGLKWSFSWTLQEPNDQKADWQPAASTHAKVRMAVVGLGTEGAHKYTCRRETSRIEVSLGRRGEKVGSPGDA